VLDVTPTILDLLGLQLLQDVEGVSVVQQQPGRALPLETRAPWFYYGLSSLTGVRRDGEKLVGAPDAATANWILSHPGVDPSESEEIPVDEHPLLELVRSPAPTREALPSGDADVLASLGYFGNEAPTGPGGPANDPRQHMDLIVGLNRANLALVSGDLVSAELEAAGLRATYGEVPELLYIQGRIALDRGDWKTAIAYFDEACGFRPTAALYLQAGMALLPGVEAGEVDAAEAAKRIDKALAIAPGDPRAIAMRALADVMAGRPGAALARVESALADRPRNAHLRGVQMRALNDLGRLDEAREVDDYMRELWPRLTTPR